LLGFIIFTPTYKFNGQIADHLRRLDTSHVTPCKGQIPVASGQRHQKRVPTFHLLLLLQPDPIRYFGLRDVICLLYTIKLVLCKLLPFPAVIFSFFI
jgi:hypothetical protein